MDVWVLQDVCVFLFLCNYEFNSACHPPNNPACICICLCVCVRVCVSSFSAWGNKRNPLEFNNAGLKKGTVNKALKVTQPVFSIYTHIQYRQMVVYVNLRSFRSRYGVCCLCALINRMQTCVCIWRSETHWIQTLNNTETISLVEISASFPISFYQFWIDCI